MKYNFAFLTIIFALFTGYLFPLQAQTTKTPVKSYMVGCESCYKDGLRTTLFSWQECSQFMSEIENGVTSLIESIPTSNTEFHNKLRGCWSPKSSENVLMTVARSTKISVERKLEIFKLLIEKYHFHPGLLNAPRGHYTVFNLTVSDDQLFPLTEYLISQDIPNYTFLQYWAGDDGTTCRVPAVAYTFIKFGFIDMVGSPMPKGTIEDETFKYLVRNGYASRDMNMDGYACFGKYVSLLEYLKSVNQNGQLNSAIDWLKSQ